MFPKLVNPAHTLVQYFSNSNFCISLGLKYMYPKMYLHLCVLLPIFCVHFTFCKCKLPFHFQAPGDSNIPVYDLLLYRIKFHRFDETCCRLIVPLFVHPQHADEGFSRHAGKFLPDHTTPYSR